MEEIARELGVSRQALYNWTQGISRPNRANAERIAAYFGMRLTEVWIDDASASSRAKRVARLERFVRGVEELLAELYDEADADEPVPDEPPDAEYPPDDEVPRRRRATE